MDAGSYVRTGLLWWRRSHCTLTGGQLQMETEHSCAVKNYVFSSFSPNRNPKIAEKPG